MKAVLPILALGLVRSGSGSTWAMNDEMPMTATYMLFSQGNLGDPPPGTKEDDVGIYMSGEAAWKIYYAMDVPVDVPVEAPVQKGGCDDAMMYKEAGDLVCYLTDIAYCAIGIVLRTGKATNASIC